MNHLAAEQSKRNAASRDRWELFQTHRAEVTKHLTRGFAAANGRICVLGAGNSNDLELAALCQTYREVHLVDLDAEALASGIEKQRLDDNARVFQHGDVDLTGVYDEMAAWINAASVPDSSIDECLRRAESFSPHHLPAPFDVVGSVCLLSQIIDSSARALGDGHPRFADLMLMLRKRHVQLLLELLAPGGWGVLVSDFVSSETCPELAVIPAAQFPLRMQELITQGNFFHGVNPYALAGMLREDPELASDTAEWQLVRPWRWDFGSRVYAVFALKFRRAP